MQVLSNNCSLFFNIAKQLFYFKNWQILAIVRFRRKLGTGRSLDTDTEIRCPMSDVRHRIRCTTTGESGCVTEQLFSFPPVPREIPLMQVGARQLSWAESEQSQKSGLIFRYKPGSLQVLAGSGKRTIIRLPRFTSWPQRTKNPSFR